MDDIMGTTLLEGSKWALRYEGGGGNKVPLMGPPQVLDQLKRDDAKIFKGFYSRDHRGIVVGAHVQ